MSGTVPQSPQYFIKVYGSQQLGDRPKFSHTFATFIEQQVRPDESTERRNLTISWLPRDETIDPLGPPEPGRNFSLCETLAWLDQAGSDMRWESPETEIEPELFQSAIERIEELNQGVLQYVMIDSFQSRPHQASNCIHAVTDLPLALRRLGMAFTGICTASRRAGLFTSICRRSICAVRIWRRNRRKRLMICREPIFGPPCCIVLLKKHSKNWWVKRPNTRQCIDSAGFRRLAIERTCSMRASLALQPQMRDAIRKKIAHAPRFTRGPLPGSRREEEF